MESIESLIASGTNEELNSPDMDIFKKIGERITKDPSVVNKFFENIVDKLRFEQEKVILHTLALLDYLVNHTTPLFLVNLYGQVSTLLQLSQNTNQSEAVRAKAKESLQAWEGPLTKCVGTAYQDLLRTNNLLLTSEEKKKLRTRRKKERLYLKLRSELKQVIEYSAMIERNVDLSDNPQSLRTQDNLQMIVNCREMQRRIIFMIEREQVKDEDVFIEMLTVNDRLAQSIMMYDEYMQTGKKKQEEQPIQPDELGLPMFGMDQVDKEEDEIINLDMLPSPVLPNQDNKPVEHTLDSFLGNQLPPQPPQSQQQNNEVSQQMVDDSILSIIANREEDGEGAVKPPDDDNSAGPVKPPEDEEDGSIGIMSFEKLKPDDFFSLN